MLEWIIREYLKCREFQRAQTMTEYVMVLSAIAIAALVAYQSFGSTISTDVVNVASDL